MVTEELLVPDGEREKIVRDEELETLRSTARGAIYYIKDLTSPTRNTVKHYDDTIYPPCLFPLFHSRFRWAHDPNDHIDCCNPWAGPLY